MKKWKRRINDYIKFIFCYALLSLTFCNISNSQTYNDITKNNDTISYKIKQIKINKIIGYIFPKEYIPTFKISYFTNRFTLDSIKIIEVEKIIKEKYIKTEIYEYKIQHQENPDEPYNKRQFKKLAKKQYKDLDNYYRQYIGFYNKYNQKCVFIEFLDIRNDFDNLTSKINKDIVTGFGDWYEKHTFGIELNLENKTMFWFGWADKKLK